MTERQGSKFCVACRAAKITTPSGEPLQLDHKQPLSAGGDNHHLNLQWLCRSHNTGKGGRKRPPDRPRWKVREGR